MTSTIANQQEYDSAVAEHDWVLIDFWATWCGPCKSMTPVFEAVAEENQDAVFAAKVDVDQFGELAASFNVRGVPTLALLHQGKLVSDLVGAHPQSAVESWLNQHLTVAA